MTDSLTYYPVADENLVTIVEGERTYCFDISSLYTANIGKDVMVNPFTRVPLPDHVSERIMQWASAHPGAGLISPQTEFPDLGEAGEIDVSEPPPPPLNKVAPGRRFFSNELPSAIGEAIDAAVRETEVPAFTQEYLRGLIARGFGDVWRGIVPIDEWLSTRSAEFRNTARAAGGDIYDAILARTVRLALSRNGWMTKTPWTVRRKWRADPWLIEMFGHPGDAGSDTFDVTVTTERGTLGSYSMTQDHLYGFVMAAGSSPGPRARIGGVCLTYAETLKSDYFYVSDGRAPLNVYTATMHPEGHDRIDVIFSSIDFIVGANLAWSHMITREEVWTNLEYWDESGPLSVVLVE